MTRYGRRSPDQPDAVTPRTVFVEAHSPASRLVTRQLELDHRGDGFHRFAERRHRAGTEGAASTAYRSACPIGSREANAYNHIAASPDASAPATMSRPTCAPRAAAIRSNSATMRSSMSRIASTSTRVTGFVGPGLDRRPRIRIVGLPLQHPDPLTHHAAQSVASVTEVGALGDVGQRTDVTAGVPTADLAARRDQHHAERRVVGRQTVRNQLRCSEVRRSAAAAPRRAASPPQAGTSA